MQGLLWLYTMYYSWSFLPSDACHDLVWQSDIPHTLIKVHLP